MKRSTLPYCFSADLRLPRRLVIAKNMGVKRDFIEASGLKSNASHVMAGCGAARRFAERLAMLALALKVITFEVALQIGPGRSISSCARAR